MISILFPIAVAPAIALVGAEKYQVTQAYKVADHTYLVEAGRECSLSVENPEFMSCLRNIHPDVYICSGARIGGTTLKADSCNIAGVDFSEQAAIALADYISTWRSK